MPIKVICDNCKRTIRAGDELSGKRVKCPGCGSTLEVLDSASDRNAQPTGPQTASDEEDTAVSTKTRKRRRRKTKGREPVFSAFGIELTRGQLIVAISSIAFVGVIGWLVFALTPAGRLFSGAPDVQIVDVYTAVNSARYTDVGERVLQSKTVAYTIPGHRKLLVTRPSSEGGYLLVKLKVPYSQVADYFAGSRGRNWINKHHIQLEDGSEKLPATYVTDRPVTASDGFHFGYSPPKESKGSLKDYLGPRDDSWTHDGERSSEGSGIKFRGRRGMVVTTQIGGERLDGVPDHGIVGDLTGTGNPEAGKGFDKSGLVAGPAAFIKVTWDEHSDGWLVDDSLEEPNEIGLNWEITCLFPRPKNASKELNFLILNKPRKMKMP